MRLTLDQWAWRKQIALHNAVRHHPSVEGLNKMKNKADPPQVKENSPEDCLQIQTGISALLGLQLAASPPCKFWTCQPS
jgi:hypothetical protein